MENAAPRNLIVCLLKTRAGDASYREVHERAAEEHTRYMSSLWRRGIFWAGGPLANGAMALEIYSVDSVEDAMQAQRNAPHFKSGFLYEDKYFEWTPRHWPPQTPDLDAYSGKVSDR
jgi:uncharacterized protein YciI